VIFRRPVCYVNYVPFEYLQTYHRGALAIWKHHEKDGKRMTVAEIYACGAGHFMRADQFENEGITLVDNTPEEIKAVALEMVNCIEAPAEQGTDWSYQKGPQRGRIDDFWDAFPRGVSEFNKRPLHGEIRMRIGAEFLRGYQ
jgi:putative glycosyltransferase (TIGR04372 family)